jgi:hypothetical protein
LVLKLDRLSRTTRHALDLVDSSSHELALEDENLVT